MRPQANNVWPSRVHLSWRDSPHTLSLVGASPSSPQALQEHTVESKLLSPVPRAWASHNLSLIKGLAPSLPQHPV